MEQVRIKRRRWRRTGARRPSRRRGRCVVRGPCRRRVGKCRHAGSGRGTAAAPARCWSPARTGRHPELDGLPLVLVLHGLGQNAEIMAPLGAFSSLAATAGRWWSSPTAGTAAGTPAGAAVAQRPRVDDVAYLDALIDEVVDRTGASPAGPHGRVLQRRDDGRYLCEGRPDSGERHRFRHERRRLHPTRPTDFIQISGPTTTSSC